MSDHPTSRRTFMGLLGALGLGPGAGEAADGTGTDAPATDAVTAQTDGTQSDGPLLNDEFIVQYHSDVNVAEARAAAMAVMRAENRRAQFGSTNEELGFFKVNLVEDITAAQRDQILTELQDQDPIETAVVDATVEPAAVPNDTFYDQQNNAQWIGAETAWDQIDAWENRYPELADPADTTVAIVESGRVQHNHEDLRDGFANPPGMSPHFEIIPNVGQRNASAAENLFFYSQMPVDLHATGVAGIAGATRNNQRGVAGISHTQLVNFTTQRSQLSNKLSGLLFGIQFAVEWRSDIINMSTSYPWISDATARQRVDQWFSQRITDALTGSESIIIAAAGNDPNLPVRSPAKFDDVVAVSSTEPQTGALATESTSGPEIDITAPGVNVATTAPNHEYVKNFTGTSAATPVVSGVAALGSQIHSLGGDLLRERLLNVAAEPKTHNTDEEGNGRVYADRMVGWPPGAMQPVVNPGTNTGGDADVQDLMNDPEVQDFMNSLFQDDTMDHDPPETPFNTDTFFAGNTP